MRIARGLAIIILPLFAALWGCAPEPPADIGEIQDQIVNLLELETYEHVYRDVVHVTDPRRFLGIQTGIRQVLFSVDIRVTAGLDLGRGISVRLDENDTGTVYVQLPEAQVLSVDADETSIREYLSDDPRRQISLLDLTSELTEAKERTREDSVERGILDRAQANATQIVRNFLRMAGFTTVEFAPPRPSEPGELEG